MSKNTDSIKRKIPYLSGDPNWSDVMKAMLAEFEEIGNAIAGLRLQMGRIQKRAELKGTQPSISGSTKVVMPKRK